MYPLKEKKLPPQKSTYPPKKGFFKKERRKVSLTTKKSVPLKRKKVASTKKKKIPLKKSSPLKKRRKVSPSTKKQNKKKNTHFETFVMISVLKILILLLFLFVTYKKRESFVVLFYLEGIEPKLLGYRTWHILYQLNRAQKPETNGFFQNCV